MLCARTHILTQQHILIYTVQLWVLFICITTNSSLIWKFNMVEYYSLPLAMILTPIFRFINTRQCVNTRSSGKGPLDLGFLQDDFNLMVIQVSCLHSPHKFDALISLTVGTYTTPGSKTHNLCCTYMCNEIKFRGSTYLELPNKNKVTKVCFSCLTVT